MSSLRGKKGNASALIILVLTLLVMLAVLGLVTTAADRRLALKRTSWQQEYYQLDGQAAGLVGLLDQFLQQEAHLQAGQVDQDLADRTYGFLKNQALSDLQVSYQEGVVTIDFTVGGQDDQDADSVQQLLDLRLQLTKGKDQQLELTVAHWLQRQTDRPYTEETGIVWIPD